MADDELDVDEEMDEDEGHVHYDIASYPSDLTLNGIAEAWAGAVPRLINP
jgi:hypothetical protein